MTTSFKLSELSANTLVGRDIGKQTRTKLKKLLDQHEKIEIDMEDNHSISPSFLDEVFVYLVVELGKEEFNKRIKVININAGVRAMMNAMLNDKLKEK